MDTRTAAQRWKETWERAWPAGDVDAIAALYGGDAVYRALAFGAAERPRGYLERVLPEGSDVECWFGEPLVDGSRAAVEWWGTWLEEGRRVTLAGSTLLRFDERGLVVDHRDYWNDADRREPPYEGW